MENFSDSNVIGAIKYLNIQQVKWFLFLPEFILMLQWETMQQFFTIIGLQKVVRQGSKKLGKFPGKWNEGSDTNG